MLKKNGDRSESITIFQFVTGTVWTEGVRALLESPLGFTVVGEADSVTTGLPRIRELRPEVILCGFHPENFNPPEVVSGLRHMRLDIPVLVLTTHADPGVVHEVLRAPVNGYLVARETTPDQLALAIQSVRRGLTVFGPTVQKIIAEALPLTPSPPVGPLEGLTAREKQVLGMIVLGMGNREIASALSVSLRTVQLHTSHLLAKLGARSRLEAAVRSLQGRAQPAPVGLDIGAGAATPGA